MFVTIPIAPENAWRRAVDIMESAQKEGLDITADTTPFREGIGAMYSDLAERFGQPWSQGDCRSSS